MSCSSCRQVSALSLESNCSWALVSPHRCLTSLWTIGKADEERKVGKSHIWSPSPSCPQPTLEHPVTLLQTPSCQWCKVTPEATHCTFSVEFDLWAFLCVSEKTLPREVASGLRKFPNTQITRIASFQAQGYFSALCKYMSELFYTSSFA